MSTIDVISIALQASEQSLMQFTGDTPWALVSVYVKAPTTPVERGLDCIPFTTSFQLTDGDLKTKTEISGFTVITNLESSAEKSETWKAEPRVYSDLFRSRVPIIHDIQFSAGVLHSRAEVPLLKQDEVGGDIDAHRRDSLNAIDAFVIALQLGHVLLYDLDGLTRAESETLWMRTTQIVVHGAIARSSNVSASLKDSRIRSLRGDDWRLATIQSSLPELFDISCTVAHRLPLSA